MIPYVIEPLIGHLQQMDMLKKNIKALETENRKLRGIIAYLHEQSGKKIGVNNLIQETYFKIYPSNAPNKIKISLWKRLIQKMKISRIMPDVMKLLKVKLIFKK